LINSSENTSIKIIKLATSHLQKRQYYQQVLCLKEQSKHGGEGATMKSEPKALDSKADLIKALQYTELKGSTGILETANLYTPARITDKISNCDRDLLNKVADRFTVLFGQQSSDGDGIVIRCMEAHITTCVENGFITNIPQGRKYMEEMIAAILQPLVKIDIEEANSSKSTREEKISAYMKTLDDSLKDIIIKKESFMSVKENAMPDLSITTIFHPIAQQAMVAEGLSPPNQTTLMRSIQLFKNNMSTAFVPEAITKGISDELTNKYNRLNMLIDESLNIINAYKIKQPVNLEKLKVLTELTNALQAICDLPPEAINSESITPITNQLRTNLLVTYEDILESEQLKSPGFDAKSSSTLRNIATALQKDEKLVPPQIKRTSFSANERPAVKPAGLVKSVSNIMPAPEKPSSKEALSTDMFVGHTCQFAHYYSKNIDMRLDNEINLYSPAVRDLLSGVLDAGYSSATVKGTPDGKILAIIKNSIAEAITNGDIASRADGNLYATTYRDIVLKHLQKITNTDTYAKNPSLVNAEIIDLMERDVIQAAKPLKISVRLMSTPPNTTVFKQDTQNELIRQGINHPAQSFLAEVKLFKNNRSAQFLSVASTQGFSDELANKYIRLNTLIDESLKIINSYQAKQPVNLVKLKALTELANSLQNIARLPPSEITDDKITSVTNQLHTHLLVTKNNILKAETSKIGFITKSSSTIGNINDALKKDESLMSPETKKTFFSAKEKPIVKSEESAKSSVSSFFRRGG